MDWLFDLSQAMVFICGTISIWLLALNNRFSKYGPIIGLIGQPFWFYVAVVGQQWGVFAVDIVYTISYIVGIYNFWLRKSR
jgi:hypothetical protein